MAWIVGPMKYSTKSSLSVAGAAGDMTFATGENAPELRPAICTPLRPIETATPGRIAFNPTNGPGAVPTRTDFLRSPAPSGQVSRNSNIPLEGSTRHSLLIEDGESAVSYFNLEINPQIATSLVHCLNHRHKGARRFPVTAPDAQGTLIVWARDPQECREHIMNALFDLIFELNGTVSAPP